MRSDEVSNAVGEAVVTKQQQLAEKQKALEDARGRHALAKEMNDWQAMGIESGNITALREIIASIETELVSDREADAVRKAKDRLLGIRRAWDSVAVSSIEAAEQRVVKKIAELSDEIAKLNDGYSRSVQLRAEAAALSDRFNLPKPTFPDVPPPARRDVAVALTILPNTLLASAWRSEPTEQDEHEMRTRRTYEEANGTLGAEIIAAAGLKPWEPLTERQQEILAAREREKEQTRRALAGLPKIPTDGSIPLGSL